MIFFIIPFAGFLLIYKRIHTLRRLRNLIVFLSMLFLLLLTFGEKSAYLASKIYNFNFIRPLGANITLLPTDFFSKLHPELSIYFVKDNLKALLKSFPLFWVFLFQLFLLKNSRRNKELLYLVAAQVLFTFGYFLHGAYYSRNDYQDLNVLVLLILFIPWVGYGLKLFMDRISFRELTYFTKIICTCIAVGFFWSVYTHPTIRGIEGRFKEDSLNYTRDFFFAGRLKSKLQPHLQISNIPYYIICIDAMKCRRWELFSKDNTYFVSLYRISNNFKLFDSYFKGLPEDKSNYYDNGFFDLTKSNLWGLVERPIFIFVFSKRDINKKSTAITVEQRKFMVKSILVQNNAHFLFDFEGYSVYRLYPQEDSYKN